MSWFQIWALYGLPITLAVGGIIYAIHAQRQIERWKRNSPK